MHFHSKMAWQPATYNIISCNHSNRLSHDNFHVLLFFVCTLDCQEPKTSKNFSHKTKTSQHPWLGEEIWDWPSLKDLVLWWWISVQFFHEGEICELKLHTVTCLTSHYIGKHRTNNVPQNHIKWPSTEPSLHRKSNYKPKFTYLPVYFYTCIYAHISTF